MKTLLWLDDVRDPYIDRDWLLSYAPEYYFECHNDGTPHQVIWVKDHDEFVDWITANGLPTDIGFDHDLGLGPTGYDSAKWLGEYCMDNTANVPNYFIQSANPVGATNIRSYLENAKKHIT